MNHLKIAFTGPSGTGKTTLAKYLSEKTGIPFLPSSAGFILSDESKRSLSDNHGYSGEGHKNVIQLSMANPNFALEFQTRLLDDRISFLSDKPAFIVDRCEVDNMVYFLMQSAIHNTDEVNHEFIKKAVGQLCKYDRVIYIPSTNPREEGIENNGSRVSNWYYQKVVTAVFDKVALSMIPQIAGEELGLTLPTLHVISWWDLEERKKFIESLLVGSN